MHLVIPWNWLVIGELTYLMVAPVNRLGETFASLHYSGAPHPRAVMILGMAFCIVAWPLFLGWAVGGGIRAIIKGFRGTK
jgi:hypothetical protein